MMRSTSRGTRALQAAEQPPAGPSAAFLELKTMANITAGMVKELRERTGAGMMDCKQALTENDGNMDVAIDWLRKKGLSKAAKKAGRVAAQGLIGIVSEGKVGAAVEINSETDFVARNPQFQQMVTDITKLSPKADGDLAKLLAMKFGGKGQSVEDYVKDAIATIGENMSVRRSATVKVGDGVVADYIHNKAVDGAGKMGILVGLESKGDTAKLLEFGRQLAMHIAAADPKAITADELDKELIEKERAVYTEQAVASGKSADIVAKMVEGRLKKEFYQQVVLLQQIYVLDGKTVVADAVKAAEKDCGAPIQVTAFVRYALGEGIEKKEEDFAAEVAKAVEGAR
jgi:elongation factor Ts